MAVCFDHSQIRHGEVAILNAAESQVVDF
jgi:hypothetical protein